MLGKHWNVKNWAVAQFCSFAAVIIWGKCQAGARRRKKSSLLPHILQIKKGAYTWASGGRKLQLSLDLKTLPALTFRPIKWHIRGSVNSKITQLHIHYVSSQIPPKKLLSLHIHSRKLVDKQRPQSASDARASMRLLICSLTHFRCRFYALYARTPWKLMLKSCRVNWCSERNLLSVRRCVVKKRAFMNNLGISLLTLHRNAFNWND